MGIRRHEVTYNQTDQVAPGVLGHYYSGKDGRIVFNGQIVAKTTAWSISAQVAALPVTTLGDIAERYTPGLKSASGEMTIWYYNDAPAEILRRVIGTIPYDTNEAKPRIELGWGDKSISFWALLTSARWGSSVGAVMSADVSFVVDDVIPDFSL